MARTLLLKGCDILLEMDRIQICGRTHGYRCTPPRPPRSREEVCDNTKVQSYMKEGSQEWNLEKLRAEVVDEDYNTIVALKISSKVHQDLYGWHYNEDGIYTVKSGYWLATHLPNQNFIPPTYGNVDLKQKVWKTKTPSKVQHFLWKLLSRSLATGNNLRRRHITNDTICKRCYMEEETEEHIFFTCPYAKQIWRASGVANPVFDDPNELLDSKVKVCMEFASSSRLVHF